MKEPKRGKENRGKRLLLLVIADEVIAAEKQFLKKLGFTEVYLFRYNLFMYFVHVHMKVSLLECKLPKGGDFYFVHLYVPST